MLANLFFYGIYSLATVGNKTKKEVIMLSKISSAAPMQTTYVSNNKSQNAPSFQGDVVLRCEKLAKSSSFYSAEKTVYQLVKKIIQDFSVNVIYKDEGVFKKTIYKVPNEFNVSMRESDEFVKLQKTLAGEHIALSFIDTKPRSVPPKHK